MKKQLSLRHRIVLGYLPPLLLMVVVCVLVIWKTQTMLEMSRAVELAHSILENVKDMNGHAVEMQKSARGYMLARNEVSRRNYGEALATLRETSKALEHQIVDKGQLQKLHEIRAATDDLAAQIERELQFVDNGEPTKAVQLYATGNGRNLGRAVAKLISEFEQREAAILKERQGEESRAFELIVNLVLIVTMFAIVLAIALIWWVATRISGALVRAVASMTSSSAEIASTVDEHERVVSHQAAAVNETTTTVEELGVSASQSAVQAESAAEAARQALEVTQDGIELANQVSASMLEMKHKVGSVAEQILRLSEQAGQIGSIARVVGEIAGETNMLALNAAVEAARAGEHGKGFAVVAAEVRKLADQSKKSAERANVLVNEIQKATNAAVMVTEQGSQTTEDVSAMMGRTIAAFGTISSNANSVSVSAQQVLMNSRQQASALAQVTEAMKSLAAGAAQMAAGTEQTKHGTQNLNRVAIDLQAMV